MQQPAPSEGLTRNQIVAAIKDRGFTLEKLSVDHGLSSGACSVALSKPWPRVERIIARTIGVSPQKIWPPRYSGNGVPIKRGGKVKSRGRKRGDASRSGSKSRPSPATR